MAQLNNVAVFCSVCKHGVNFYARINQVNPVSQISCQFRCYYENTVLFQPVTAVANQPIYFYTRYLTTYKAAYFDTQLHVRS